jgi:hypothetical protein
MWSKGSKISPMRNHASLCTLLVGGVLLGGALQVRAQTTDESLSTGCALKDHIYTCDKAVFQTALTNAKSIGIDTHSMDKLAQAQLTELIVKKLGKTLAETGSPADLVFLIVPVGTGGVTMGTSLTDVGSLRVYSANPDGTRAHLLWAEDCFGQSDMPWPTVVHTLILQFQSHFKIK